MTLNLTAGPYLYNAAAAVFFWQPVVPLRNRNVFLCNRYKQRENYICSIFIYKRGLNYKRGTLGYPAICSTPSLTHMCCKVFPSVRYVCPHKLCMTTQCMYGSTMYVWPHNVCVPAQCMYYHTMYVCSHYVCMPAQCMYARTKGACPHNECMPAQ